MLLLLFVAREKRLPPVTFLIWFFEFLEIHPNSFGICFSQFIYLQLSQKELVWTAEISRFKISKSQADLV